MVDLGDLVLGHDGRERKRVSDIAREDFAAPPREPFFDWADIERDDGRLARLAEGVDQPVADLSASAGEEDGLSPWRATAGSLKLARDRLGPGVRRLLYGGSIHVRRIAA